MLKKSEVIDVLENGGYILLNEVYRSATVYNLSGDRVDVCRYDTAERLEKMEGYGADVKLDPWSYTRQICIPDIRRELKKAATERLTNIKTPGNAYGNIYEFRAEKHAHMYTIVT